MSSTSKVSIHDLDVTPEELDAMSRSGLLKATLLADAWVLEDNISSNGSTTYYTQTVTVNGVKGNDKPIISCGVPSMLNADNFNALDKNYAMINRAIVEEDDKIRFYCYSKKPTVDIPLFIKV